jgi:hypothetical protein
MTNAPQWPATERQIRKVLAAKPDLDYRDARDLAIEHGADGVKAGRLALGRPGSPGH